MLPGSEGRTLVPGDPEDAGPCKSPPPLQQNTQYRISIRHNTYCSRTHNTESQSGITHTAAEHTIQNLTQA